MKVWHCYKARSMRALWALEEMGIEYEVVSMPFPPRFLQKDFLEVNDLGTIPYMIDGETHMTESSGIPLYLVERYGKQEFGLKPDHPEYGDYLNWLFHSDATLTFPQTIFLRYSRFESDRGLGEAGEDYRKWYLKRLTRLNRHLLDREFLVDKRFTIADIDIAYALYLGEYLGIGSDYEPQVDDYLQRMKARPGFQRAAMVGEEHNTVGV
ncbi:glutathione S-transferase family protein [Pseudomaricurvus alkylphenolicus]|nr:glutathione S-transferase family protein [Pseudomaricurvus alkylphenolicus]